MRYSDRGTAEDKMLKAFEAILVLPVVAAIIIGLIIWAL